MGTSIIKSFAALTTAVTACATLAILRLMDTGVAKVDQGVQVRIRT